MAGHIPAPVERHAHPGAAEPEAAAALERESGVRGRGKDESGHDHRDEDARPPYGNNGSAAAEAADPSMDCSIASSSRLWTTTLA